MILIPTLLQMVNLTDLQILNYWQEKDYFRLAACVRRLFMLVEVKMYIGGDINKLYWAGNGIEDYLNRLFDKNCKPQEINNIGVSQQMGR